MISTEKLLVFNSVKRLFAIIGGSRSKERAVGGEERKKTRALSKMHEVNKWTENPGFKNKLHTQNGKLNKQCRDVEFIFPLSIYMYSLYSFLDSMDAV